MHGDFFVCHGFALQHDHASRQSTSDAILSQFPKCRPDVISLRLFSTSEIMGHVNRVATCNCFLLLFHEEFLSTFGEAYTYANDCWDILPKHDVTELVKKDTETFVASG